jgi:glutamate--cysteine ligase catalytic subunit
MGFIFANTTLNYNDAKPHQQKMKKLAVRQFINLYKKFHNVQTPVETYPKWGYELEIHTLKQEKKDGRINYACMNDIDAFKKDPNIEFEVTDEFGHWMIEMIPREPFDNFTHGLKMLSNLRSNFRQLYSNCRPGTEFLSSSFLPKFGTQSMRNDQGLGNMSAEEIKAHNEITRSRYLDDRMINKHPRYRTLATSLLQRRGEGQNVIAPLFQDVNTNLNYVDEFEPVAGHTHNESATVGCGLSCLQVTFASKNMKEARWATDQMHQFTSIFVSNPPI